MLNLSTVNLLY